jgi:hypothetical protein
MPDFRVGSFVFTFRITAGMWCLPAHAQARRGELYQAEDFQQNVRHDANGGKEPDGSLHLDLPLHPFVHELHVPLASLA